MGVTTKTNDNMVADILSRIMSANIGFDSTNKSSVLYTIIAAIVEELGTQYYQLSYLYDMMSLDTATGDDLDRLVAILNTTRIPATSCIGSVVFSKNSASNYNILIPKGTLISTRSINGVTNVFVTNADATITAGSLTVNVEVTAVNAGYIIVPAHTLVIMNDPIMGIDTVDNPDAISGGSEVESDTSLRYRAKLALPTLGKATSSALEGALMSMAEVENVKVKDMARGVATSDVIVTTKSIPPSQITKDKIQQMVIDTKASGVDVGIIYPSITNVDISVSLITVLSGVDMKFVRDSVGESILSYMSSLNVNDTLIIKQLETTILSSTNSVKDLAITVPTANVIPADSCILRAGVITIDGEVWTYE